MNLKSIVTLAFAGTVSLGAMAGAYKVNVPMGADEDGAMAFLVNYDDGSKVDSVLVADGAAVFEGDIDAPVLVRLLVDGNRMGSFVVEPGETVYDMKTHEARGTVLNDRMSEFGKKMNGLAMEYRSLSGDDEATNVKRRQIEGEYDAAIQSAMKENIDNPFGYMLFLESAYGMSLEELKAMIDKNPSLKKYKRVTGLVAAAENKASTQPGAMFKDFEITYGDGTSKKLSDYVGKGKYTLVDFWASWCGPCIRETAVIKDIYNEYGPKGLEVLGVAVWDEPENTKGAIEKHQLPWPQIINAQTVPTELYGISGIPCIIIFGPDGKILSRDKQGDALRADVKAAMEGLLK